MTIPGSVHCYNRCICIPLVEKLGGWMKAHALAEGVSRHQELQSEIASLQQQMQLKDSILQQKVNN